MANVKKPNVEDEWHEFLISTRNFQELSAEELVKFLDMDLHEDFRAMLMQQLKAKKGL